MNEDDVANYNRWLEEKSREVNSMTFEEVQAKITELNHLGFLAKRHLVILQEKYDELLKGKK